MKKFLVVFLIAAVCTSFAFSDEAEGAEQQPIVTGSASLKWGIDLGAGVDRNIKAGGDAVPKHGFYNTNSIKVVFPFTVSADLSGGSSNKEAGIYGVIDVAAFGFSAGSGGGLNVSPKGLVANVDNVDARLVFYGAYITVFNKPDFGINFAKLWAPITATKPATFFGDEFAPSFEGWGTKIGYSNEKIMNLDAGFKFGSNGNWESKPADPAFDKKSGKHDSKYGFGFDFSLQPSEMLDLAFSVNGIARSKDKTDGNGVVKSSDWGYNVGIDEEYDGKLRKFFLSAGGQITAKPMEGFSITAGFDGAANHKFKAKINGVEKEAWGFAWDAGLGVGFRWVDAALYANSKGTALHGWDDSKDIPDTANMALHLGLKTVDGDKNTQLLEGLSAHVGLNIYDLLVKRASSLSADNHIRNRLMAYNALIDNKTVDYKDLQEELSEMGIRDLPIGLNVGASYKVSVTDSMWLKPYFEFYGETNHIAVHKSIHKNNLNKLVAKPYFGVAYEVGLTFSPVEKVEIDANWAHGKISNNSYEGGFNGNYMIEAPVNNGMHNGTFVLSLNIKY